MKLRHVVLFGFGKAHSSAAIAEVIRQFAELKALVPGIDDFEQNSSPEGLDHGHSHVFLLTFASARRVGSNGLWLLGGKQGTSEGRPQLFVHLRLYGSGANCLDTT